MGIPTKDVLFIRLFFVPLHQNKYTLWKNSFSSMPTP